jgi:hypothetical protein
MPFPPVAFASRQGQTLCDMLLFNQTLMRARIRSEGHRGLRSTVRFALQRIIGGPMTSRNCTHLGQIRSVTRQSEGCEQCLALGDTWVHLRMCMTCGQVGCCDSSKNKHAHAHARELDHQIARSVEPGEDWLWCYADELIVSAP